MPQSTTATQVVAPGKAEEFRRLNALEELFFLVEQRLSKAPVIAAELEGSPGEDAWRTAVSRLQQAHPLLTCGIRKQKGERPVFVRVQEALPLSIHPVAEKFPKKFSMDREMENLLHGSFGDGSGVPLHVHIYQDADRCVILLRFNHTMLDGVSGLLILRDLLTLVSGSGIAPSQEFLPGLADFLDLPSEWNYASTIAAETAMDTGAELAYEGKQMRAHCVLLDADLTGKLVDYARSQGVTVHGILVGALTLAAFRCSTTLRTGPMRIVTPVDVRSMFGLDDSLGLFFSMLTSEVEDRLEEEAEDSGTGEILRIARKVKEDVRKGRTREAVTAGYQALLQAISRENTPEEAHKLAGEVSADMMVSNYGSDKIAHRYGNLEVQSLYVGSSAGSPDNQKVDIATLNGRLSMTLVSQRPIPGLLEEAVGALQSAIA